MIAKEYGSTLKAKVRKDLYQILKRCDEHLWFCRICKSEVKKTLDRYKALEVQNQKLTERIKDLEMLCETLTLKRREFCIRNKTASRQMAGVPYMEQRPKNKGKLCKNDFI